MVNLKSSVFLFVGNDNYSKDKAIDDLRSSLLGSALQDLNYRVFYGKEDDGADIISYITTIPFSSAKRIAVVKDFDKLSKESRASLISYIKNPAKSACLILESKDALILKEHNELAPYVNMKKFGGLKGAEILAWIKRFLDARGKGIDKEAALILQDIKGSDLSELGMELEKLISFAGSRKEINIGDVETVVGKGAFASALDITSAVGEGRLKDALAVVSDMISEGKRHYEIIGLLCWHIKRVLRGKVLRAKAEPDSYIADLLNVGRKYQTDFFKQLGCLGIPKIQSMMSILLEADLDIKRTRLEPGIILELAIIRLCLG